MTLIPLSQHGKNRGKYSAIVDDEDFNKLNKNKWSVFKSRNVLYAYRRDENNKSVFMHNQIMNSPNGMVVDHIDHNGLNCQKNNMRRCTNAENNRNKTSSKNSTSKYLGVCLYRKNNGYKDYFYWAAQITYNYKRKRLGLFHSEIEAAKCYNEAAIKYHGEFANLNNLC